MANCIKCFGQSVTSVHSMLYCCPFSKKKPWFTDNEFYKKKKKNVPQSQNLNQNKIVKLNKLSFSHINKPDEADQELHLTATTSNPNPEHLRVFFVMRLLTVLSVFLIGSPSQKNG